MVGSNQDHLIEDLRKLVSSKPNLTHNDVLGWLICLRAAGAHCTCGNDYQLVETDSGEYVPTVKRASCPDGCGTGLLVVNKPEGTKPYQGRKNSAGSEDTANCQSSSIGMAIKITIPTKIMLSTLFLDQFLMQNSFLKLPRH